MTDMIEKTLYSIKETQEALGVSRDSVYKLIKLGKLSSVHILTRNFCTLESIEAVKRGKGNDNGEG